MLLHSSGMMVRRSRFYIAVEETAITADGIERIPKSFGTKDMSASATMINNVSDEASLVRIIQGWDKTEARFGMSTM